jgi:glycosyltransferase involved in cell wall biosynthesis
MLRVAFNGRFSGTPQPTGTQTASFQLFNAILREARDFEAVVFADSRFPGIREWERLPRLTIVEVPFQDWSRERAQLWEQWNLPRLCRQHRCVVAHHPMTTSPLWRNGVRSIVTLHDLNFYLHPEWFSRAFRLFYRLCAVPALKQADRVVTISRYVEKQASQHFHVGAERLRMIYNGVKPLPPAVPRSAASYLLCVGSLQPHKNLARMIKAFLQVKRQFPELELHVVGRPQARFTSDPELPSLLSVSGVQLLGYLSEADLASAYSGAAVFCYPSLEEGFGLPVLEAMMQGTLVLTSNVSCLPEVSGPATLVDPFSVDAIALGVLKLLRLGNTERISEIEKGRAWASKFTWRAAAREYLALYRELL